MNHAKGNTEIHSFQAIALALVVDDIDALLARIAAYGWKAQGTPQPIAGGARAGTRVIYVVGPDGATIEFMQPPLVTATTDPSN